MHTRETDAQRGFASAAKTVADHLSSIVRLELELATVELRRKLVALGFGIGLAVGAAVFLLLMLGFALATLAAVFATFLSTWLALLIVTGIVFGLVGLLAALAVMLFKRGTPPVPEHAIREAKLTTETLKSDGGRG